MIQTDILQTVFAVKGLSSLIGAFDASGAAQKKLEGIEAEFAAQTAKGAVSIALHNQMLNQTAIAADSAANAETNLSLVMGGMAVQAIHSLIGGLQEAVQSYAAFGEQVMNLRDLTGASARESVEAAEMFRVAGVKDQTAIKESLRLAKDLVDMKGNAGLSALGISPQAGENSIHLLGRISDALNRLPAGMQRTAVAEEIFGARGVQSMLPFLRMTEAQREAVKDLSDSFGGEGLAAIQEFGVATRLLGETVLFKLAYPLAHDLLPSLIWVTDEARSFVNVIGALNEKTHGLLGMAVAFGAIGAAVGTLIAVIPALFAALSTIAVVEAVIDALSGNWANLAMGAIVGASAGIALYNFGQSAQSENTTALNANTESHLRVAGAMNRFNDNWQQANMGGIPRGLARGDVAELARLNNLGLIG